MKLTEFFHKNPVFTSEEFAQYLVSRGEAGPRTQETLLTYYKKTGRILGCEARLVCRHPGMGRPRFISGRSFPCRSEADQ